MEERAANAGVLERLRPIPAALLDAAKCGSTEQAIEAKKTIKKLQIANQQIVARAEKRKARTRYCRNGHALVSRKWWTWAAQRNWRSCAPAAGGTCDVCDRRLDGTCVAVGEKVLVCDLCNWWVCEHC